jgi:hypothetical protein
MHNNGTRQIESPGRGGGWIKRAAAVDHHHGPAFAVRFAGGYQGERPGPAAGVFAKPFDE